ncbi:MAG: methyltransferase [Methylococcaceae bacterium]|nr:MAG: methyltransferase [Methylococcaceae bacterium]
MNDWTAGYVADIGYTYGYYTELNPLRAQLAFLSGGYALPAMATCCELGFGQGMSTNIHAAASNSRWWATDFNPAQASFAQNLAAISGAGAQLFDQSFAEFCSRSDLPDFDYIGLHGIWSWISDENRAVIADFVCRKLKVGGVLYISYNTQPGWAAMVPMRHLLTEHSKVVGAPGQGIVGRIDAAIEFTEKLLATQPMYARANPHVVERIKQIKGQNRNYLAHEYFNRDWEPMPFAAFSDWLTPAKLNYACSAHYLDHVDIINMTAEQQQFLQAISDATFRETVRDYMINQQFRRDYWVKGGRKLSALEQAEALRKPRIVMTQHRADVTFEVNSVLGKASLQESVYAPILDALADHQPKTLGQLEQLLQPQGVVFAQLLQAIMILIGKGTLTLAQDEAAVGQAKPHTDKLNARVMDLTRGSSDISYLASPVTGGGISVSRFAQLFLMANAQGETQPEAWAGFVWGILKSQNQQIIKEGKMLKTAEENLAELTEQAREFAEKQLPLLKALAVV